MCNIMLNTDVRSERQLNRKLVFLSDMLFTWPCQTFFIDI